MGPNEATEQITVYVEFRPGPAGEMRLESASKGLSWLYRERPQVFADMMLFVNDLPYSAGRPRANGRRP
jgi:hypothetical protein